jgi:hypothetical protein
MAHLGAYMTFRLLPTVDMVSETSDERTSGAPRSVSPKT